MAKSYLRFEDSGTAPSGKTKRWNVREAKGGDCLGSIAWYSAWRRYTYRPGCVILDAGCMREIATFLERESADHFARIGKR